MLQCCPTALDCNVIQWYSVEKQHLRHSVTVKSYCVTVLCYSFPVQCYSVTVLCYNATVFLGAASAEATTTAGAARLPESGMSSWLM